MRRGSSVAALRSGQASLCPLGVPSRRSVPSGSCRDPAGLRARGGVVRSSQRPAGPSQVVAGTSMRASSADPPCPVDTTERRAPADARHRGTSSDTCVCVLCGACQCGAVQCSRVPPETSLRRGLAGSHKSSTWLVPAADPRAPSGADLVAR
ncbi:unnamed protein product [Ixodes hexagonus]